MSTGWAPPLSVKEALQELEVLADWFDEHDQSILAAELRVLAGRAPKALLHDMVEREAPSAMRQYAQDLERRRVHAIVTRITAQLCDCWGFDSNGGSGSCKACLMYSAIMASWAEGHG